MDLNPNERNELDAARSLLGRLGFRRCDVAACNCGSYHQHRPTLIEESLAAQVKALLGQRDHWMDEHEKRRGECLAAFMVERASQDRAELLSTRLAIAEAELERLSTPIELFAKQREILFRGHLMPDDVRAVRVVIATHVARWGESAQDKDLIGGIIAILDRASK
jgi:hypothetical protein